MSITVIAMHSVLYTCLNFARIYLLYLHCRENHRYHFCNEVVEPDDIHTDSDYSEDLDGEASTTQIPSGGQSLPAGSLNIDEVDDGKTIMC